MPKFLRCRPNQLHSLKHQNMYSTVRFFRVFVAFLVHLWHFLSYVNTRVSFQRIVVAEELIFYYFFRC
jgi:hypothetical protein